MVEYSENLQQKLERIENFSICFEQLKDQAINHSIVPKADEKEKTSNKSIFYCLGIMFVVVVVTVSAALITNQKIKLLLIAVLMFSLLICYMLADAVDTRGVAGRASTHTAPSPGMEKFLNNIEHFQLRLSDLKSGYLLEKAYLEMTEEYPGQQICVVKREAEDPAYIEAVLRIEETHFNSDNSIVSYTEAVLCEEQSFSLQKELFEKIFAKDIHFAAMEREYKILKQDVCDYLHDGYQHDAVDS